MMNMKSKRIMREIIRYLIVGILTTIISLISYCLFSRILQVNYFISNFLSWICAVSFAYFANKKIVFRNESKDLLSAVKFLLSRVLSLLEETLLFWIMIEVLKVNDFVSKFFIQSVVIVTNYIMGKFFAFKAEKEDV